MNLLQKSIIDLLLKNIKNLKKSIEEPGYPSNWNTISVLNKYQDKLKVFKKSNRFKKYIEDNS